MSYSLAKPNPPWVCRQTFAASIAHQTRRFHLDERLRDGKLYALIAADRPVEYDALVCILDGTLDEPITVADALGGDQRALGIQAVEDVLESLAFLPDQVLGGHLQVVEKYFVGLVIHHVGNRTQYHALADGIA